MVAAVRKGRRTAVRTYKEVWRFTDGTERRVIYVGAHRRMDAMHYEPGTIFDDAEPPRKRR